MGNIMKINRLYTGIALATTLILTGCGDDNDDNVSKPDNNGGPIVNNELKYSVFDPFSEVVNNKYQTGWGKLAYIIGDSKFSETISTVLGSSPNAYQEDIGANTDIEYYASKNAFAAIPAGSESKFLKFNFTDSDTFKLRIKSNDSSLNFTYDIVTLDLTGVGKQPRNATTGIDTDLDYFPEGFNATFPSGSQCYILQETPSQSYYAFYDYDAGKDITLDEWIADKKEGETIIDLVTENVGRNNELPAVRYTNEYGEMVGAVAYKGLIYNAFYNQKDVKQNADTNPDIAEVYCNQYNDVATKFFEAQIKANY